MHGVLAGVQIQIIRVPSPKSWTMYKHKIYLVRPPLCLLSTDGVLFYPSLFCFFSTIFCSIFFVSKCPNLYHLGLGTMYLVVQ